MTKSEALQAMQDGKKVYHTYFLGNEFLYMIDGIIYDETDLPLGDQNSIFWVSKQIWTSGWFVIEDFEIPKTEGRSVGYVGLAVLLLITFFVGFLVSMLF